MLLELSVVSISIIIIYVYGGDDNKGEKIEEGRRYNGESIKKN